MKPGRTWLWVVVAATLLTQSTVYLVRPTTTYKLLGLGYDGATVGLITGLYALLPLTLALLIAARAQRTPSLAPMLAGGAATLAGGAVLIEVAPNVGWIAIGTALLGLGQMVFIVAAQAAAARFASDNSLDSAFGWFTAGISGGQMVGPLVGGVLIGGLQLTETSPPAMESVNKALLFGSAGAVSAMLLILLFRRSFRTSQGDSTGSALRQAPSVLDIIRSPGTLASIGAATVLVATVEMLSAYLPLVGEEAGLSPAWVGLLLAIRAGASLVSRVTLPVARRWASRRSLLLFSLVFTGISLAAAVATITDPSLTVVLMLVAGLCMGMGTPLTMSIISESVPAQWRSSALTLSLAGNRMGQVLIPVAAGAVVSTLGAGSAIWLSCLLLLASAGHTFTSRTGHTESPP